VSEFSKGRTAACGKRGVTKMETDEEKETGIIERLAHLPPGALITESGLADIFGKCRESIKSAVDRGELPHPVRIMGKPTWTAGAIIRHVEDMLAAEARKFRKHSS